MRRDICTLPFDYVESREQRAVSLEKDGIPFVPVLGYTHFADSRPYVDEHRHPGCIEIAFCQRGSLCFELEGTPFQLRPGDLLLIQPEVPHHLISNQKGMIMYGAFLRRDLEGPILKLPEEESEYLRKVLKSIPSSVFFGGDQFRKIFKRLFTLYDGQEPGIARTLFLRNGVLDLILAVTDAFRGGRKPLKSSDRLEALIQMIIDTPEKELTIPEMAALAALSESMINLEMRKATGVPPHAFLLACRMRKALELIRKRHLSTTELSLRFHFSSPQHFSSQFRRFFGITPSQARKGGCPVSKQIYPASLRERFKDSE